MKKVILISFFAHYEADAVNYFNHNLEAFIASRPKAFIKILQGFNGKQIISVWTFYFDYENCFDRKKSYNRTLKLISPINKNMTALITSGYEKSSAFWKNDN
jgi:hypothetical protein